MADGGREETEYKSTYIFDSEEQALQVLLAWHCQEAGSLVKCGTCCLLVILERISGEHD